MCLLSYQVNVWSIEMCYHSASKIYHSFGNMIVDLCPNYGDYLLGFGSTIDFTD